MEPRFHSPEDIEKYLCIASDNSQKLRYHIQCLVDGKKNKYMPLETGIIGLKKYIKDNKCIILSLKYNDDFIEVLYIRNPDEMVCK
jgi:hypothetical protein